MNKTKVDYVRNSRFNSIIVDECPVNTPKLLYYVPFTNRVFINDLFINQNKIKQTLLEPSDSVQERE